MISIKLTLLVRVLLDQGINLALELDTVLVHRLRSQLSTPVGL